MFALQVACYSCDFSFITATFLSKLLHKIGKYGYKTKIAKDSVFFRTIMYSTKVASLTLVPRGLTRHSHKTHIHHYAFANMLLIMS